MKILYLPKKFTAAHRLIIAQANEIIEKFQADGYDLTLRQLYYQFVSKALIENNIQSYKRLGGIINDGRLAGLIDWSAIVDRTRGMLKNSHWNSPADIVRTSAEQYQIYKGVDQPNHVEVWIEKDALIGVIEGPCSELDVPYFSCRGYVSQSEMWNAAQRVKRHYMDYDQQPIILHLGDHDPSGIDMTRDIQARFNLFAPDVGVEVKRIALNMNQIRKYDPPPNPAKLTDSRATYYIDKYGDNCWELDALSPAVLDKLIRKEVLKLRDAELWDAQSIIEEGHRKELYKAVKTLEKKKKKGK